MIVLSDSDVVRKLACCGLLLEFLQLLKCPPHEMWILAALPHMLRRDLAGTPAALQDFEKFFLRVRVVPRASPGSLGRFSALDPGEQQLFALLLDQSRVATIVSGDKRALREVASLTKTDSKLNDRLSETTVLCFEAILLMLMQARGFGLLMARVNKWRASPEAHLDGAVARAFPEQGSSSEHAEATLRKYVADLRGIAPFATEPPL